MKKVVLGVVVVAVMGLAVWQGHKRILASAGQKGPQRSGAPVAVETQPIRKGEIRDIGVFTGSLSPKSQFVVAPKVAGWLRELLVDIGDSIGRNEVIAVLDDEQFTRQVEQATAELQVAKATVENSASDIDLAKREYERVRALREKQIASAAEMDAASATYSAAQTRLKVAQAQAEQKEAALKVAQLQLSYTKVQAFWEGGDPNRVVGERFVDEGALVSINQPIVSILENDPLVAVVFVIERDYPKMSIGQGAVVTTDAYPGRTFAGTIRRIAPLLRESSRQARVEIEIANRDHQLGVPNAKGRVGGPLKPGMFVRALVEFGRHDDATLIPVNALVRRASKEGVFIVDSSPSAARVEGVGLPNAKERVGDPVPPSNRGQDARDTQDRQPATDSSGALVARFVPVTTGIVSGEIVEVVEPAVSGLVVTLGNHLLEDGSRVILPKPLPGAGVPPSRPSSSEEKKQGGSR